MKEDHILILQELLKIKLFIGQKMINLVILIIHIMKQLDNVIKIVINHAILYLIALKIVIVHVDNM